MPIGWLYATYHLLREPGNSIDTMSTYKRCDQRNLMWVWISSHSFALKRIRFWMSSFHKQSTSSKVLYNVNLQAMWSEKSHVGLDFLTQLCAEKDPFLNVILPLGMYRQQSPLQCQLTSEVIREISCGFGFLTRLCAEKDPSFCMSFFHFNLK